MPIFFEGKDGRLGLSLEDSAAGRCHGLRNAQQFAPLGQKSTTHIRIGVSIISRRMIRVACLTSSVFSGSATKTSSVRSRFVTRRVNTTR